MAVSSTPDFSQPSASRPVAVPPLSSEEEDQIILTRITNDERPLKRVIKRFHNYTSHSHTPVVPAVIVGSSVDDAREAFLVELATFELSLKKSAMICEAEARQVEEYQRERQKIDEDHGTLRGQIEELKIALEHAQMLRRRKIEYDLVAEKVNTLPSREELEQSIQALENDIAAIRSEHDTQNKIIQGQKSALDGIISDLGSLRILGKDRDGTSDLPSARVTPAPEEIMDIVESTHDTGLVVPDVQVEEKEEGEEDKPPSGLTVEELGEDDIEMGEVEEPKNDKGKKKFREELEEGEASDTSSALSDPPDD